MTKNTLAAIEASYEKCCDIIPKFVALCFRVPQKEV